MLPTRPDESREATLADSKLHDRFHENTIVCAIFIAADAHCANPIDGAAYTIRASFVPACV